MNIPDFQTLMKPFLEVIENGETFHLNDITKELAAKFNLSSEDLKIKVPSGQQLLFRNRITWTASHLKKAGLISSNGRGAYKITPQGKDLVNNKALPTINLAFLKTLEPFKEWESTFGKSDKASTTSKELNQIDNINDTPDIIIGKEIQKIEQSLKYDLLEMIKGKDPAFFEYFVLQLLSSMGYGGTEPDDFEVVGQSSDGGIDGIIYQDKLRLDKIYVQAKRWKDNKVASKDIRDFIGALNLKGAVKGVFITTSFFTDEARSSAIQNPHNRVVLIDGEELTDLALKYNVGVQLKKAIEVKEIDLDFFE